MTFNYTSEAMRANAAAMVDEIRNLLEVEPTPSQWQVIESHALGIADAARKAGHFSAAVLVASTRSSLDQQHETAMTVQLDRMGMSETAGRLDPVFANIIKAAGMQ